MKDKTILITSFSYLPNIGGIENSLRYLAQSYNKMGYRVIIVVSKASYFGLDLADIEEVEGITVYRFPNFAKARGINRLFRSFRSASAATKLYKHINAKYNIVLTLSRFHTTTVLAKRAGLANVVYLVPGVVKNQDNNANTRQVNGIAQLKAQLTRYWHHQVQKKAFLLADQVMVFSNNMLKQINEIVPSIGNLPIVKPGVDAQRFCSNDNKKSLKERYSIPANKTVLLTVGRFVLAKGFDYVVDAMQSLPDCHLVMVGDGPNKAALVQKIDKLALAHRITLVGSQNDTAPFYQLADVFIMTSVYEPLGQTILEALASGLPVVAFSGESVVTATAEMLAPNEAVYCTDVSVEGIVQAVSSLLNNQEEAQRLSLLSRDIAVERFSWDTLAKQVLAKKES